MKKILLNPVFPFLIKPLNPNILNEVLLTGCYQMIYLKKGIIYCENEIINKESLCFVKYNGAELIKRIFSIHGFQVIFKKNFLNYMSLNDLEKQILLELNFINPKEENKTQIISYPLSQDLSLAVNVILNRIHEEFVNKERAYHSAIKAKLLELFITCYRYMEKLKPELFKNSIDRIIDYIDDHYSENLNLQDLSHMAGFNPSYLSRIFKEKTGWPIFEYINQKRIYKATMLLKNSKMSIIEISMTVGYNNLSFFYRTFKKIMNTSPKDYRSKNKM